MRRSPADGEVGVFCVWWSVVMEVLPIPKPKCYDSVPPCFCKTCQRYDMHMALCVPRTFGESTSGLAVVNAARSSFADVHSRSVRCKPARSRPVAPPVTSTSVAVSRSVVPPVTSKSVAPPVSARSSPVSSSAPFGSRARSSTVAVPTVVSSSSSVSVSSLIVGRLACPVSVFCLLVPVLLLLCQYPVQLLFLVLSRLEVWPVLFLFRLLIPVLLEVWPVPFLFRLFVPVLLLFPQSSLVVFRLVQLALVPLWLV